MSAATRPEGPPARRTQFSALHGWTAADLRGQWKVLQASARSMRDGPSLRAAVPSSAALLCALRALDQPSTPTPDEARALFESLFDPFEVGTTAQSSGFLTGYYEPFVDASLTPTTDFIAPVLSRPDDLVTLPPDHGCPGIPSVFAAARRRSDGGLEPYPDRAALEAHASSADAQPIAWLRDWTELFLVQVQGSARLRLRDGSERRLVYDGRNGHPYTSIGRLLIESGEIRPDAMSLDALKCWLREHGQAWGDEGRAIMQQNRSYIFFRLAPAAGDTGPIGGAGLPLTAGVSITVDRTIWSYGLPFWIASDTAVPGFGAEPLDRLFVAQDTGSAIVGPSRADLFMGSGEAAGRHAGAIRHAARFTVLWPRAT